MYLFNQYNTLQTWIILGASIIGCIAIGILFAIATKNFHPVKTTLKQIKEKSSKSEDERLKEAQKILREQGNQDKSDIKFMSRLDTTLEKSGLKRAFPFLNSEIFILFNCITFIIVGCVVEYITSSIFFVIVAMALMLFLVKLFLFILVARDENIIDKNIIQFSDLLESYSNTSDDIIHILDQTAPDLDEPLRSVVKECVTSSRLNGDMAAAFQVMTMKINHRKFNELIQSIEECSRNNADYSKIIRRAHESISTYVAEKEVRKTTANQAKLNIVIIVAIFFLMMYIISGILGMNVVMFLFSSTNGKIVLFFCGAILLYTLWKLLTMGEK